MKKEDLMIGDWVKIQTCEDDEPMYSQVEQLWECEIDADFQTDYENIHPIELTKEILYKNGFDGDGCLWINVGNEKTLEYYPFEHRLILWYGKGKNQEILFKCQCFYVHEFQHALKMCGIKKEIVL